ncbi:MAG: dienelactone hydrolase, partial [Deinococcus sp.]|nr:dienelactone hydrolase [Deinococcus sp.]
MKRLGSVITIAALLSAGSLTSCTMMSPGMAQAKASLAVLPPLSVSGDLRPDAPALSARGSYAVGVQTL